MAADPIHQLAAREVSRPIGREEACAAGGGAQRSRRSSRVIVDLIEAGLDAREQEKKTFFERADRLASSSDASEQKRLKQELARMTYGE